MSTTLINLTDAPVLIQDNLGNLKTFDPTPFTPVYEIKPFHTGRAVPYIDGYRADAVKQLSIANLPPVDPFKAYIVSVQMLALVSLQGRYDFFSPDYKNHPVIDPQTKAVIGCTRFITLAQTGVDAYLNPPFLYGGRLPSGMPSNYGDLVTDMLPGV